MHHIFVVLLSLHLVGCFGSFAQAQAHDEGFLLLQMEGKSKVEKKLGQPRNSMLRPGENVTIVEFGILLKDFYGMDMPSQTWTADVVTITRWADARDISLIPDRQDRVRLDMRDAAEQIWLPDIKVTNIAQGMTEIISSSILLSRDGIVTSVERAMLTMKSNFDMEDFPFDVQQLEIRLASSTYMSSELKLVPTPNASLWGADKGMRSSFYFLNSSLFAITESDGPLDKNRGIMATTVKRSVSQYVSTVFLPSNMLLGMTWTSLWLPLGPVYTMPRVALNAIALLAQVSLGQKVESFSPSGQVTWLDSYIEMCFSLQFGLLFMNAYVMMIFNKDKGDGKPHYAPLAESVELELSIVFPFVWLCAMLCAWYLPVSLCRIAVILFAVFYLVRVQCMKGVPEDASEAG